MVGVRETVQRAGREFAFRLTGSHTVKIVVARERTRHTAYRVRFQAPHQQ